MFRTQGDPLVDKIDAILPQTQCGQCGYPGCKPYATAIAGGDADINQCPPGGDEGVRKLADLLGREYKPLNAEHGVEKPKSVAVIDEATCIGCTLCIQACPVDAIVGAAKQMHTIVADLCTGCELCVPPCPADCIDMVPVAETVDTGSGATRCSSSRSRPTHRAGPCSEGSRLTCCTSCFSFNGGVKPDPNKTLIDARADRPPAAAAAAGAAAAPAHRRHAPPAGRSRRCGIARTAHRRGRRQCFERSAFAHVGPRVAVEPRPMPHASGLSAPSVVIEPDGLDHRWNANFSTGTRPPRAKCAISCATPAWWVWAAPCFRVI
jgi:electron transport complex protein RnfB